MATTFLAVLSVGLITTYVILIYNMHRYFKQQMKGDACVVHLLSKIK